MSIYDTLKNFADMRKFHVTFGERKKLLQVEDTGRLNIAIRKSFGIKEKFFLQQYVQDVSDWVDLDDVSEVDNCGADFIKLKVWFFYEIIT